MNGDLFSFDQLDAPGVSAPAVSATLATAPQDAARPLDHMTDRELVAAFLGAPQDVAGALLARFGSVAAVMAAPPLEAQRVRGVTGSQAQRLAMAHALAVRGALEKVKRRPIIGSWTALRDYVGLAMAHETIEQFRVVFLDKKNQLIADEVMNTGTVDHAPVYVREVIKRALQLDASAIVLVHNHPSGDPTPSGADIDMTRQIVEGAKTLRLAVHDHLVVGKDGIASFKALGLF